jgi:phage terminase large subunit GpA-like protein
LDNDLLVNPVGEIASKFLREVRANGHPGAVWETETLGRPRRVKSRSLEVEHLRALATGSSHVRGKAPVGTVSLVAAVDVQTDRAFVLVGALSPGMRRVAVVDWFEVVDLAEDAALEAMLVGLRTRTYAVDGGPPMGIMLGFIDTGHRATTIYQIRHRMGGWLKLVKGRASRDGQDKDLFRLTQTAAEQVTPLPLLVVNVGEWKNTIAGSLSRPVGKKDAEVEADLAGAGVGGGAGLGIDLPRDVDQPLLSHLTSERLVGGLWQIKREGLANHWLDDLVYLVAGSVYYRGRSLTRRLDVEAGDGQARQDKVPERGRGRERERRGGHLLSEYL